MDTRWPDNRAIGRIVLLRLHILSILRLQQLKQDEGDLMGQQDANSYFHTAKALEKEGRYAEACGEYEKAVEADPDCAEAWMNWGGVLIMSGLRNQAPYKFKMFMKLIKKADLQPLSGIVSKDMLVTAFESLRTFAIIPLEVVSYFMWGIALCMYVRYEEAGERFQTATDMMPEYADAYYAWALALAARGMYEEATRRLQKAIEITPEYAEAYHLWGLVLKELKKETEAEEMFRKAEEIEQGEE